MSDEQKKITEINAEERRQKREKGRRLLFERLRGIVKFLLVVSIITYSFIYRAQIGKVCYTTFDRVMKHITLSSQTRQKAADYQNQIDEVTTNSN